MTLLCRECGHLAYPHDINGCTVWMYDCDEAYDPDYEPTADDLCPCMLNETEAQEQTAMGMNLPPSEQVERFRRIAEGRRDANT